jgi:Flp pilus assembly protein TadG
MRRLVSLRSNRSGGFVEFTLLLPFLVVLVSGTSDLGLALFAAHSAQSAARAGALRAASLPTNPCMGSPDGTTTVGDKVHINALLNNFTATCLGPIANPNTGQQEVTVSVSGLYNFSFLRLIGITSPLSIMRSATVRYEGR